MSMLGKIRRFLTGGFAICKLRITPWRLRFWRVRTLNSKPDIDSKL
ncbi:MAG: hypothetical protein IKB15_04795 [Alistipes sp.]|nr:hypothetical protein [Alistipes sp.]